MYWGIERDTGEEVAIKVLLLEHARERGNVYDRFCRGSVEELVRTCMKHHRAVLIEMARGREATLEVVHLNSEATAQAESVAILGTSSSESGAKEWEQLVARMRAVFGPSFVVLPRFSFDAAGATELTNAMAASTAATSR